MRGPLRGRGPLRPLRGLLWLRSRRLPSLQSLRGLFRLQLRLLRFLGRLPLHLLEALFCAHGQTRRYQDSRLNCCVARTVLRGNAVVVSKVDYRW